MTRKPLLVLDPAKLTDRERTVLFLQGYDVMPPYGVMPPPNDIARAYAHYNSKRIDAMRFNGFA